MSTPSKSFRTTSPPPRVPPAAQPAPANNPPPDRAYINTLIREALKDHHPTGGGPPNALQAARARKCSPPVNGVGIPAGHSATQWTPDLWRMSRARLQDLARLQADVPGFAAAFAASSFRI
eukprot:scaffold197272_cov31-Tisochrysis_lutea.AAC.1